MSHRSSDPGRADPNPVLESLAERRRRELLGVLLDRTSPVAERDLAIQIAAAERGTSVIDVTREEVASVRADLRHVHLPDLEATNLVVWDREDGTANTTDHPALRDPRLHRIVEVDATDWDAVVRALAHERRRVALSVLASRAGPLQRDDLVRAVAERLAESDREPDERAVRVSFHHRDLPTLAAADLVDYDADAGTVAYEGHADLDEAWFEFVPGEPPRSVLPAARLSPDIWCVESQENVLEQGRSIIDQAEDELFLMFTTDALLEEECIRAFENAVDRGVDVYLGAQSGAVRDLVRERVPEVVIWEPQLDWLNLPPKREKVGRVVFADRETIMLGTLGEETEAGVPAERAITGAGQNNALVVLMQEMLGSRLDHLDAQSEDFLSQISF